MSWNIWWRFGANWRDRQSRIIARLQEAAPDVVGLQEAWGAEDGTQADVIADALNMHAAFAAPSLPPTASPAESTDQEGIKLGVAVLSRWPILATRHHFLPCTHRGFQPVALRTTLHHPAGPMHVFSTATEWEPAFAADHGAQISRLAELVSDPALDSPLPVVLAADLNAAPDSAELRPLLRVMVDTWVPGGGSHEARTLRSEHPFAPLDAKKQLDRRIDYVLARPGRPEGHVDVRRAFTLGEPIDGLYPSDHDAVVVDLAVSL